MRVDLSLGRVGSKSFVYKLANNDSKGFRRGWKSLKGKKNLDVNHL